MKFKFMDAGKMNQEIKRLENLLNIPERDRKTIFRMKDGHARIDELEAQLRTKAPAFNDQQQARTFAAATAILAKPVQLFTCPKHVGEVESADAQEPCPKCGRTLYPVADASGDIVAQYKSIKSPSAKTAWYRKNKAAYDAAWRAQHPATLE